MKRGLAAGVALAAALSIGPARGGPLPTVEVFDNDFTPVELAIPRGGSVTWVVRDGGHTITADDGRFTFPPSGTAARGDTFTWTVGGDETVSYHCLVHRPAMRGVIVVGAGSPPPPPPPSPPRRVVPSDEYPTLARALAAAPPTTIIDLEPGTYRTSTVVTARGVTIRGAGSSPADVVIDGDGTRAIGLDVRANGVRVENLSVREHGLAGISFEGVRGGVADRIEAVENAVGIRAMGSRQTTVTRSTVSASSTGILVQDCARCDAVLDGIEAAGNGTGILIRAAGAVAVLRSTLSGNGIGVRLTGAPLEQRGAHVWGNVIDAAGRAPATAGLWIDGGSHDVLERNTVAGYRYGILVTGTTAPSHDDRIVGNTVDRSAVADLAWDGVGVDVCFSGNRRSDGSAPSSAPPAAETIYPCSHPHTVGIPWLPAGHTLP